MYFRQFRLQSSEKIPKFGKRILKARGGPDTVLCEKIHGLRARRSNFEKNKEGSIKYIQE